MAHYWKQVDNEGKTISVTSCSVDSPLPSDIQISESEYNDFIRTLPPDMAGPKPGVLERLAHIEDYLASKDTNFTITHAL